MSQAAALAAFSRRQRIPAVSGWLEFADEGNLLTDGPNLRQTWLQAASFMDRLLRGGRASELPVEQPTHHELVLNLKRAAALGLKQAVCPRKCCAQHVGRRLDCSSVGCNVMSSEAQAQLSQRHLSKEASGELHAKR